MSNFDTYTPATGGIPGTAPQLIVATTDDNLAAITTAGYLSDLYGAGMTKDFDIWYINYDVDGTEACGVFVVTSTSGGSLVAYPNAIGGALLAANNLSDLANKLTAQGNLGLKKGTTAAYAGGGTSNAYTATGLVATDVVVATILASTNSVSITKAVPSANTLTVTFSADPGADTTVQWHAVATV